MTSGEYKDTGSDNATSLEKFSQRDHLEDGDCDDQNHLKDFISHVDLGIRKDLALELLLHQEVPLRNRE